MFVKQLICVFHISNQLETDKGNKPAITALKILSVISDQFDNPK